MKLDFFSVVIGLVAAGCVDDSSVAATQGEQDASALVCSEILPGAEELLLFPVTSTLIFPGPKATDGLTTELGETLHIIDQPNAYLIAHQSEISGSRIKNYERGWVIADVKVLQEVGAGDVVAAAIRLEDQIKTFESAGLRGEDRYLDNLQSMQNTELKNKLYNATFQKPKAILLPKEVSIEFLDTVRWAFRRNKKQFDGSELSQQSLLKYSADNKNAADYTENSRVEIRRVSEEHKQSGLGGYIDSVFRVFDTNYQAPGTVRKSYVSKRRASSEKTVSLEEIVAEALRTFDEPGAYQRAEQKIANLTKSDRDPCPMISIRIGERDLVRFIYNLDVTSSSENIAPLRFLANTLAEKIADIARQKQESGLKLSTEASKATAARLVDSSISGGVCSLGTLVVQVQSGTSYKNVKIIPDQR